MVALVAESDEADQTANLDDIDNDLGFGKDSLSHYSFLYSMLYIHVFTATVNA